MSFNLLPLEIYTSKIIPCLSDAWSICAFAGTSKVAYALVHNIINLPHEDIDFTGQWRSVNFDDRNKTIRAYVLQKLKIRVLENHPEMLEHLAKARVEVEEDGQNPNDIACLLEYANDNDFIYRTPDGVRRNAKIDLISCIIPFAIHSGMLDADKDSLGDVLQTALLDKKIDLVQLILVLPESGNIQGESDDKNNNLGKVLTAATAINSPKLARKILGLPHAKDIVAYKPARDDCLGATLCKAAQNNNLELTELVLVHPNAEEIPGDSAENEGTDGMQRTLFGALLRAVAANNIELVQTIVAHPNAKDIPLNGYLGFGVHSILTTAVNYKNQELIIAVLQLPQIIELPSDDLLKAIKAVIPEKDKQVLLELQQLLDAPDSNSILDRSLEIFDKLSEQTKHHLFLLLCNTYGSLTENIDTDGMAHFIDYLDELSPYINKIIN